MDYKAKAIQLLGEKKKCVVVCSIASNYNCCQTKQQGSNQMHSKAVEVVVGLLGKLDELEKWHKRYEELQRSHIEELEKGIRSLKDDQNKRND